MIDTHCHLFSEYYNNIDEVIDECKNNGIKRVIVSGCDMKSNMEVLELVNKYDIVYGTLGFHPTELEDFDDSYFDWLEKHICDKGIVGIGEIGLDYHYEETDRDKEIMVFKRQLDIATKYNKPIIVHSRDSIQDTYNILKEYNLKGSIHCFSGSVEMGRLFTRLGYKLGVGGIVTYKNAKTIKEVVKDTDMAYILLETDSPYLSPVPYRGTDNKPYNVSLVAEEIASLKNTTKAEVIRVTTDNAKGIFDFFSK